MEKQELNWQVLYQYKIVIGTFEDRFWWRHGWAKNTRNL